MSSTANRPVLLSGSSRLQQENFFHDLLDGVRFRAKVSFRVADRHTEHSRQK
jgi:hypothetical protein